VRVIIRTRKLIPSLKCMLVSALVLTIVSVAYVFAASQIMAPADLKPGGVAPFPLVTLIGRMEADSFVDWHARKWPVLAWLHEVLDCWVTVTLEPQWTQTWPKRPLGHLGFGSWSTDLGASDAQNARKAICNLTNLEKCHSHPFHTVVEQLYRCWSWWQLNPNAQHIACFAPDFPAGQWSEANYTRVLLARYQDPIVRGLLDAWKSWHPTPGKTLVKYTPCARLRHADHDLVAQFNTPLEKNRTGLSDVWGGARLGVWRYTPPYFEGSRFFASPAHAKNLRALLIDAVPLRTCHEPSVAILNRMGFRHVTNTKEIAEWLRPWGRSNPLEVMFFENKPFIEQVKSMSRVDILIAPHGAQLWAIPFMPQCSGVIELYPRGYSFGCYVTLASDAEVLHMSIMLSAIGASTAEADQDTGFGSTPSWSHARSVDMCPAPSKVAIAVRRMAYQRCACMVEQEV